MNWIITLCFICATLNISASAFRINQVMKKQRVNPKKPLQPLRKAAGFVIYRRTPEKKIEYLLIKAASLSHHWTPPKGHLEENESAMEAAIRETKEEAGIITRDLEVHHNFEKVLRYEPKGKDFIKQVTYWLARLINSDKPITLSHEHLEYSWLELEKAKEFAAYPELQKLFDECENYLVKNNN